MPTNIAQTIFFALAIAGLTTFMAWLQDGWILTFFVAFVVLLLGLLIREAASMQDTLDLPPQTIKRARELPVGFGRALIEQLPSPLIVIEVPGRISYFNAASANLLPRLRIGDHFANLLRAPRFVEAVNAVTEDGESREIQFELQGNERLFEAQIAILPPGGGLGNERQVIVKIEDRTEARRSEEMRTSFVANASHELRTPLASIIGYIETLQGHA